MNYYYLISSLPSLTLETAPPFSFAEFVKLCSEHLTKNDLGTLLSLDSETEEPIKNSCVRSWKDRESLLRNALTKLRAVRLKKDAAPYIRETEISDSRADKIASEALARDNPLDRELLLDKFRWQQAEELAGFNPFSSDALIAYALKLKLAERWAGFDEEKARTTASGIINKNPGDKENIGS